MKNKSKLILSIVVFTSLLLFGIWASGQGDRSRHLSKDVLERDDPPETVEVELYFGNRDASGFIIEKGRVDVLHPEALMDALIEGPTGKEATKTIPEGTRCIRAWIDEEGIAYVDLSKELVTEHWGGSAGEQITLYSIVNTLTRNMRDEIEAVQILIEGEIIESLAGHYAMDAPLRAKE